MSRLKKYRLPFRLGAPLLFFVLLPLHHAWAEEPGGEASPSSAEVRERDKQVRQSFEATVQPLLRKYCLRCHNADEMKSGVRVDRLDGTLPDRNVRLWEHIQGLLDDQSMPPEDEPQPTAEERRAWSGWIADALIAARSRETARNGAVRRLTVAQYRNTLRDLLQLRDDLTDVLPPDAVSKDGFVNNEQTMLLSPLLLEAYLEIADKALDRCIVEEHSRPVIQNFRMELGEGINPDPCPDKLILGALSHLLENDDFLVRQLTPTKPFPFEPLTMRTNYRFIEGYQGNATVRGWREFDSIYHAVFACMRGTNGYPKGRAYEPVPEGLLLRPAIPSAELFQVESTYGPRANFKISLRELPDRGNFRVTVTAAKYDDGLLLDPGAAPRAEREASLVIRQPQREQTLVVARPGIYQADVYLRSQIAGAAAADHARLGNRLIGYWSLDGHLQSGQPDAAKRDEEAKQQEPSQDQAEQADQHSLTGERTKGAEFVESPFGQAVSLDGKSGAVFVPPSQMLNVGRADFSVAAWIHPDQLRQAGIVVRGGYGYTHGWILDMPDGNGVLRIETADPDGQHNGTVQSSPGVIRANRWQHVAVVVGRGEGQTRLYVNGYEVARGTVKPADLDNPEVGLHIGRVPKANPFPGRIDEVRVYARALDAAEIQALVEPGRRFAEPPREKPQPLRLRLGDRYFSGTLAQPAFLVVRLPAGPLPVAADYAGRSPLDRLVLTPLADTDPLAREFVKFERRAPRLGVHLGLRRDCGSTLAPVGPPQTVSHREPRPYIFEGAIANYPSPDVEKNNVNYLAGIREIGVRSEYTDGRDMPRLVIQSVEFEGPYHETWPPVTHRNIFIDSPRKNDPPAYAREIIRRFATRAFRRPLTQREEDSLFAVWQEAYSETHGFQQSVKDALSVVLTSPQFLFLIETSGGPQAEPLDDWELASKLSYFLWNTAPDERLLRLASRSALRENLDAEITRMVADPRFRQFTRPFVSQWLSLDKLDVLEVDRERYPQLTRDAKAHLREEPVEFVEYLFRQNLPVRNLARSDFILANEVVASYYGLGEKIESGFEFRPVRHEAEHLGGVLSQAGILAGLSDGRHSNPIKRGAWLARKIIARPPADPPPNVPELMEDTSHLPLRERLALHRDQPGCAKCHSGIDPWGLPLEQFDAAGLWKRQPGVDARSTLPDGTQVDDALELKDYLADELLDRVAFSFLQHLAAYGTGRTLSYNEIEFLREKGLELKPNGYRLQDLLRFVIQSDLFLTK